jgi:NADP-dependent 3-hydroxy acid dehydrogenase YdfG
MSNTLKVFITGSSSGLGLETIKALLRSNDAQYEIFMGSRSVPKAEEAIKSLQAELTFLKSTIEPVEIDITDDKSIEKAVKDLSSNTKYIDVLVNNAGESVASLMDNIDTAF